MSDIPQFIRCRGIRLLPEDIAVRYIGGPYPDRSYEVGYKNDRVQVLIFQEQAAQIMGLIAQHEPIMFGLLGRTDVTVAKVLVDSFSDDIYSVVVGQNGRMLIKEDRKGLVLHTTCIRDGQSFYWRGDDEGFEIFYFMDGAPKASVTIYPKEVTSDEH